MKYVIVDTDAFSNLWQDSATSQPFATHLVGSVPVLSFTTVAEAHFGAAKRGWGQQRQDQLEQISRA